MKKKTVFSHFWKENFPVIIILGVGLYAVTVHIRYFERYLKNPSGVFLAIVVYAIGVSIWIMIKKILRWD